MHPFVRSIYAVDCISEWLHVSSTRCDQLGNWKLLQ